MSFVFNWLINASCEINKNNIPTIICERLNLIKVKSLLINKNTNCEIIIIEKKV